MANGHLPPHRKNHYTPQRLGLPTPTAGTRPAIAAVSLRNEFRTAEFAIFALCEQSFFKNNAHVRLQQILRPERRERQRAPKDTSQQGRGVMKTFIVVVVAIVIALVMRYQFVKMEKQAAAQAAAEQAAAEKKRADQLAEQQRLLDEKAEEKRLAAEQRKEAGEIARLQADSRRVGNEQAMADMRGRFDDAIAARQKEIQGQREQMRAEKDQRDLERRQREELAASREKLQALENNR
jgi:hypothetical protein